MSNAKELVDAVATREAIRELKAVNQIITSQDSGWIEVRGLDWHHMLSR
jgi:hypothetical protein